jgi:glutamine synthetase
MNLVKELAIESKNIRFEGNNYSKEWQDEAAKRGLPILRTTVEAIDVFNQPKRVEFLINQNVLKKAEIESRYHIAVERYNKTLEIEFDTLLEMISGSVVPAIEKQIYFSSNTYSKLTVDTTKKLFDFRIKELEVVLEKVSKSSKELKSILEEAHKLTNEVEKMKVLAKKAIPVAEALRHSSDSAESSISDELWPYPKYREMLFSNLIS